MPKGYGSISEFYLYPEARIISSEYFGTRIMPKGNGTMSEFYMYPEARIIS
jgi:hypothetical protein